jgi:hypothetical protein
MTSPETLGHQFDGVPLYHGTIHPFEPGDVIRPQGRETYAYATPDMSVAHSRATDQVSISWEDNKGLNPTWNRPGGKQWDEYEAETPKRVYRVEPVGGVAGTHPHGHAVSPFGFRVVERVS